MKRHLLRAPWVAALIALGALAVFVYRLDSARAESYRPASAVALETDAATIDSPYTYRVGDRLCSGTTRAAIDPGSSLTVYYDRKDPCTSVAIDPGQTRFWDQAMLLYVAACLWALVWVARRSMGSQEEMTWQA